MSKLIPNSPLSKHLTYLSEGLQIPPPSKQSLMLHRSVFDAVSSPRCSDCGCSCPSSLGQPECLTAAKAISIEHDLQRSKKFIYLWLGIVLYPFGLGWSQACGCFSLDRSIRPLLSGLMVIDPTTGEIIVVSATAATAIITSVTPSVITGGRRRLLSGLSL